MPIRLNLETSSHGFGARTYLSARSIGENPDATHVFPGSVASSVFSRCFKLAVAVLPAPHGPWAGQETKNTGDLDSSSMPQGFGAPRLELLCILESCNNVPTCTPRSTLLHHCITAVDDAPNLTPAHSANFVGLTRLTRAPKLYVQSITHPSITSERSHFTDRRRERFRPCHVHAFPRFRVTPRPLARQQMPALSCSLGRFSS